MSLNREKKAKLNIGISLLGQLVVIICGLIVPRLIINSFGSEAYGATASIAQFLAYITLLEGGIGGVARAALYKPLADNDMKEISLVISEIQHFFRIISFVFLAYVIVLACSFKYISHISCFDWISTALLVVVISISTFAQYFIGISYAVLLQAAQKTYITQITSILTVILNTLLIAILILLGSNLIVVKLVSSVVFSIRPVLLWLYVKREFRLEKIRNSSCNRLEQKWTGLAQHFAYFLHSNTDIAVLTVFADLTLVAVYSVYNMVIGQIQNLVAAFSTGMEAVFGDMLAKHEFEMLHKTFNLYEMLISIVSGVLFSTTAVLIVPFVRLYTSGVSDAHYIYPTFGILMISASLLFSLRLPYHAMIIAAGHFSQTKVGAYGEAVVNITLSIILVIKIGLLGVAIGTLVAVSFRFIYYVVYLSREICCRSPRLFIKRLIINVLSFAIIVVMGNTITVHFDINNFVIWGAMGVVITLMALLVQVFLNFFCFRLDFYNLISKVRRK